MQLDQLGKRAVSFKKVFSSVAWRDRAEGCLAGTSRLAVDQQHGGRPTADKGCWSDWPCFRVVGEQDSVRHGDGRGWEGETTVPLFTQDTPGGQPSLASATTI